MKTSLHELIENIKIPSMRNLMLLVEVNIHQLQQRSLAQSMVISWMLSRYPDDEGMQFLCKQMTLLKDECADNELISGFEELRDFLLSLNTAPPAEEEPR